jgi:hypothetical protein
MTTHHARWRTRQGYPPVYPRVVALIRWWAAVLARRA